MPPVVIENPILNSAFAEPSRHFRFGEEGITNDVVEKRRTSSYFIPIAQPKKKGKQSTLYSTVSRPFAPPEAGKIAVKVINHYGDEVLKVYDVVSNPA